MPDNTASRGGPMSYAAHAVRVFRRRYAAALPPAACFLSIVASILLVSFCGGDGSAGNIIWIANGLLLAYLLLAPRWRWRAYLATGMAALIVGSALIHEPWHINLFYNSLDMIEVLVGAVMLRPTSTRIPNFTHTTFLIRFFVYAVLGGPVLAAAMNAAVQALYWHNAPLPLLLGWVSSDSLGMAVSCPIFVAILRSRNQPAQNWRQNWACLALLVGVTIAVFGQATAPVLFLIYPALVLVLLRLGLAWAALASLFVAFAGGWFTLQGTGPLAASGSLGLEGRCLVLQVFVAVGVFMLYSVSVVLESRRAFERKLEKIVALHNLITENSRDAIILADFAGNRTYVSSAVERLAGWSPEKFARLKSLELIHPAELETVKDTLRELRAGAEGAMLECRVRTCSGGYVWVESNLRLVRNAKTGAPTGVLNIVRDVTERKLVEKQLQDAYKAVEALAATDALTGLANRRHFDQTLAAEWRRSLRDRTPLSLLMIDADLFKLYNDTYGHTRGDNCLKQIAEAAQDAVNRPGDVVARFGGEEFAVILPNTDRAGAMQMGVEILAATRDRQLPHSASPRGIVTVSVGCATMVASFGQHVVNLVEGADDALYEAKNRGRDQLAVAEMGGEGQRDSLPSRKEPSRQGVKQSA